MTATGALAARFDLIQRRAAILGIAALIIAVLDGIRVPGQFFRSYLLAFVFWLGFPLGCAAFLMVHHLTGGFWGLPIRRPFSENDVYCHLFQRVSSLCLYGGCFQTTVFRLESRGVMVSVGIAPSLSATR